MLPHYPIPKKFPLLTVLVFIAGCAGLHAELKWDTQKVELTPTPTDAAVDPKFGFVNAGDSAVTIESVQSSCGCTIPTLAKKTYTPGERGEILARFNIGDRRGVQSKTVCVAIQGKREPVVLTLVVTIPEPAHIAPAMLVWEKGDTNQPKTISMQALPNQPLRVVQVTSSNPKMAARVETIEEAKDYRITVTPDGIATPGFTLITIETLLMGQKKVLTAYAQIRPK